MSSYEISDRNKVKRAHQRGHYDHKTVYEILDSMPMCHVGYVIDGAPYVTPTLQWRDGNRVYWHGSSASRMLRQAVGQTVCLTVSLLDGFVLARSPFHHSANYRSVMAWGTAMQADESEAKEKALHIMMEQYFPGRWEEVRGNTDQEMKATTVLYMDIEQASAKIRMGGPIDDEEDYEAVDCWAGVLPVMSGYGPLQPDPLMKPGTPVPDYLRKVRIG